MLWNKINNKVGITRNKQFNSVSELRSQERLAAKNCRWVLCWK